MAYRPSLQGGTSLFRIIRATGLVTLLAVTAVRADAQDAQTTLAPATEAPAGPLAAIGHPAEGKAQLVVFRSGTLMGGAISCAVHENGAKLTSLPPGRYAVLDIAPAAHDFTVESEAKSTFRIDAVAGQTYYGLCTVGMGVMAGHPHLRPSDDKVFATMAPKLKPVKAEGKPAS
jgi:hypothetical protein